MNLRLAEEYCVFCFSNTPFHPFDIARDSLTMRFDYRLYTSSRLNFAIFTFPRHLEPLLNLVSLLSDRGFVTEAYAGARILPEQGDTRDQYLDGARSIRLILLNYECFRFPRTIEILRKQRKEIGMYLLVGEKIGVIYEGQYYHDEKVEKEWLRFMNSLRWKRPPVMGERSFLRVFPELELDSTSGQRCQSRVRGLTKAHYDPITGRIAEARNWAGHNSSHIKEIIHTISDSDLVFQKAKLLSDCSRIQKFLDEKARQLDIIARRRMRNIPQSPGDSDFLGILSRTELQLYETDIAVQKLSNLMMDPQVKISQLKSAPLSPSVLLRCVYVVQEDILNSLGLPANIVAPIVDYEGAGPHLQFIHLENSELCFLSFPLRFLHRLGLYPLIAHSLAELFCSSSDTMTRLKAKTMDRIESLKEDLRIVDRDVDSFKMDLAWSYTQVFSDLISALAMGPAYLYALYRRGGFLLNPQLHKRAVENSFEAARILAIERILTRLGMKFRISEFARIPDYGDLLKNQTPEALFRTLELNEVVEEILQIDLEGQYDLAKHKLAVGTIKSSLLEGRLVQADSATVLNALWDSVFDEEGYSNEVAAFVSIFNRQKHNAMGVLSATI